MRNFKCGQCGECCNMVDVIRIEITEADLFRWKNVEGRDDILQHLVIHTHSCKDGPVLAAEGWIDPKTGKWLKRCPFKKKVRNQNKYDCAIHNSQPEICDVFPERVQHWTRYHHMGLKCKATLAGNTLKEMYEKEQTRKDSLPKRPRRGLTMDRDEYYFISYSFNNEPASCTAAVKVHPIDWLNTNYKLYPDRIIDIKFWRSIPREQYKVFRALENLKIQAALAREVYDHEQELKEIR